MSMLRGTCVGPFRYSVYSDDLACSLITVRVTVASNERRQSSWDTRRSP
jgi:hypothetical protein